MMDLLSQAQQYIPIPTNIPMSLYEYMCYLHSIIIHLQAIPDNVFIVAACNPHRGNSLAMHVDSQESWVRGSYYVRALHPTFSVLTWRYGALDEFQERDYINSKMKMLTKGKVHENNHGSNEVYLEMSDDVVSCLKCNHS